MEDIITESAAFNEQTLTEGFYAAVLTFLIVIKLVVTNFKHQCM